MAYSLPTFTRIPAGDGSDQWFLLRDKPSTSSKVQLGIDAQSGEMAKGEAFCHFAFRQIKSWSFVGEDGQPLPLTFDVFDSLDEEVTQPVYDAVMNSPFLKAATDKAPVAAPAPATSPAQNPL